jgi:hypothetical protein
VSVLSGEAEMIPEEDRGPAWLRDYGFTDFGNIEADIAAMEEFASKLAADVEKNYVPHLTSVTDAMLTELPPPAATFSELVDFFTVHREAQDATQQNVYNFANGTYHFATAAQTISTDYRGSDAFSHARVRDVDKAFDKATSPENGRPVESGDV